MLPCNVCKAAYVLVLVGAFNWGLIGLGHFAGFNGNVVELILGTTPVLENVVYLLVGLSAIAKASNMCGSCKTKK